MTKRFGANSPLSNFAAHEIEAIFAAGSERHFRAGEVIVTGGEPGDSMFFLLEGNAEAQLSNGLNVRRYEPGAYFGELSWINPGHKRSATIVASTAARLQELDQSSIQRLMAEQPKAIFELMRRTCAFLVDAERNLISDLRRRNTELEATLKKLDFTRNRLTEEERIARSDALTGLFNRRCFDDELRKLIDREQAIGSGLALVAMDLDHFKPVNDTLGHAAGDEVLRGVGRMLRENLRTSDLPCRVGGDEFIFLIVDVTDEQAQQRAEAVRQAIEKMPHPGNEDGIRCTATLGGTLYAAGESPEQFTQRADEALYAAKKKGRNQVGWKAA
jgi:diguanylate cyclase (GGDEF)-like protein